MADCFNIVIQTSSNWMRDEFYVHKIEPIHVTLGHYLQYHFSRSKEKSIVMQFRSKVLYSRGVFVTTTFGEIDGFEDGSVIYVYERQSAAATGLFTPRITDKQKITIQSQYGIVNFSYEHLNFQYPILNLLNSFLTRQSRMPSTDVVFQFNDILISSSDKRELHVIPGFRYGSVIYAYQNLSSTS